MPKHKVRPTYQKYFAQGTRYKNKIKKAKKRYGRCKSEILKKVIDNIVKHRKSYKKVGS